MDIGFNPFTDKLIALGLLWRWKRNHLTVSKILRSGNITYLSLKRYFQTGFKIQNSI